MPHHARLETLIAQAHRRTHLALVEAQYLGEEGTAKDLEMILAELSRVGLSQLRPHRPLRGQMTFPKPDRGAP